MRILLPLLCLSIFNCQDEIMVRTVRTIPLDMSAPKIIKETEQQKTFKVQTKEMEQQRKCDSDADCKSPSKCRNGYCSQLASTPTEDFKDLPKHSDFLFINNEPRED